MTRYVAVIGGSEAAPDELATAETLGRLIANEGWILVCGGLGGVMEAAARGCAAEGGTTIGILPGDDRRAANAHVSVAIPTGMGEARNALVARAADVVIALGGEFGTLSEIALALKMGKPVIGIGTWSLGVDDRPDPILRADTAEDAIATARAR
jgi:uncharacterized protein (TIGR00725 family)